MRTVKTTSKGQITIPADVMRAMGLHKGDELVVVQDGDRVILRRADAVGKQVVDDLAGWEHLGASVFADVWDNEEDEAWNDA